MDGLLCVCSLLSRFAWIRYVVGEALLVQSFQVSDSCILLGAVGKVHLGGDGAMGRVLGRRG